MKSLFTGCGTALITPFKGGEIDWDTLDQLVEEQIGNRTVLRPRKMELPAVVTKASAVRSNFLWENSSYLLGVDDKGKPERSMECFRACVKLHHTLLDEVESPAAKAVLTYFDTWQPEQAQSHPALADCWDELMKGANLVFPSGRRVCPGRSVDSGGMGPTLFAQRRRENSVPGNGQAGCAGAGSPIHQGRGRCSDQRRGNHILQ